ncbi:hypothetical protein [Lactococcus termiticola]
MIAFATLMVLVTNKNDKK